MGKILRSQRIRKKGWNPNVDQICGSTSCLRCMYMENHGDILVEFCWCIVHWLVRETRGWFLQQIQQVIQPHGRWISIQTPDNLPFRDLKEAVVTDEWTNYLGLLAWIQTSTNLTSWDGNQRCVGNMVCPKVNQRQTLASRLSSVPSAW
jgi:hypothetical protein